MLDPEVKEAESEVPAEEIEQSIDSPGEAAQNAEQAELETEGGELEVSIEGDSPPPEQQQDSSVIREMRKALREAERERKRLREELEVVKNPKQELGPKPKLDDFDYDADAYETALLQWSDAKRQADAESAKVREVQEAEHRVYAERLQRYEADKRSLRITGYADAEDTVRETLNVQQQSVLVRYFDKPAVLVAAIGSNPETAKRLAGIKDPIEFAFAVRELESKVKTTPRKPPEPESKIASAGRSIPYEARLKELQASADRSGDSTEVVRFMRAQRKS